MSSPVTIDIEGEAQLSDHAIEILASLILSAESTKKAESANSPPNLPLVVGIKRKST